MDSKNSVNELKKYVSDISKTLEDKVEKLDDKEIKDKAVRVKDKAIQVIDTAYSKVLKLIENLDTEEASKTIDYFISNTTIIFNDACKKIDKFIDDFLKDEDYTKQEEKDYQAIMKTYDKVEKVYYDAKDAVINYANKPEVQKTINDVKKKAATITDIAIDTLKDWFNSEEK